MKFKFEEKMMEKRHASYRNYLTKRCEVLAGTIQRKNKNVTVCHEESRCAGMSNYLQVGIEDEKGEELDYFTIRISDHNDRYGSNAALYIYVQNKTWEDIKKEVLDFVEKKIREAEKEA